MILLIHTLIEGIVALLFLFYPGAPDLVPGFSDGQGQSYAMLMNMYGLAAGVLAALSLVAYLKKDNRELVLNVTGILTIFHIGMAIVQGLQNPDARAMLLHFLLAIFMGGQYVNQRKKDWRSA
ncbi:hypothetical protein [Lewinella sp. 4G2]|uniref:hypothetical protein n=1 Tax=Lewinella sp. 4G2 TaxID=1803372 RepID=UPI0007B4D84A|nr:hypothetical protein [Lewinella sp. 4G2]OAV43475.1 hypothetical protein A3850_002730 [Lewinella sp. 4G2]